MILILRYYFYSRTSNLFSLGGHSNSWNRQICKGFIFLFTQICNQGGALLVFPLFGRKKLGGFFPHGVSKALEAISTLGSLLNIRGGVGKTRGLCRGTMGFISVNGANCCVGTLGAVFQKMCRAVF